jgi:hypothetical protein
MPTMPAQAEKDARERLAKTARKQGEAKGDGAGMEWVGSKL